MPRSNDHHAQEPWPTWYLLGDHLACRLNGPRLPTAHLVWMAGGAHLDLTNTPVTDSTPRDEDHNDNPPALEGSRSQLWRRSQPWPQPTATAPELSHHPPHRRGAAVLPAEAVPEKDPGRPPPPAPRHEKNKAKTFRALYWTALVAVEARGGPPNSAGPLGPRPYWNDTDARPCPG